MTSDERSTREHATLWVCVDCYLTHHGVRDDSNDGTFPVHPDARFYTSADTYTIPDREPLSLVSDADELSAGMMWDEHECDRDSWDDGNECECELMTFTWARCDGCGSTLGGERHALTVWYAPDAANERA
jgi:hypothetical protein